ncbi:sigma-70 family RNA polymerase sigma factor [Paenibacillus massiliensis]|uniref:sigma-70 family RNA polymerase sigma factor n=1 Tax=Paenibacillus massiliensis TaxID=225917 RepID=UPI0004904DB7|nr:sigma-70 family RNA polymerase sigma factor [Paenibacillus massiliensis]
MSHNKSLKYEEVEKRFVGYISSMLHYNAINFDKSNRKFNERFALIMDNSDDTNLGSVIEDEYMNHPSGKLENELSDPHVYSVFMNLTTRERQVLNLWIMQELKDKEIAILLQVTQQSVSKTRRTALTKMREGISKLRGKEHG